MHNKKSCQNAFFSLFLSLVALLPCLGAAPLPPFSDIALHEAHRNASDPAVNIALMHKYLEHLKSEKVSSLQYPPVLPSLGLPTACASHGLSSQIVGQWITFHTRRRVAPRKSFTHPLFEPDASSCLLAEERPTLAEARFLHEKRLVFMGDSHLRYLANYFIDFVSTPCDVQVYTFNDTSHKDDCFGFNARCEKNRASGWHDHNLLANITTEGGLFPGAIGDVRVHAPSVAPVNVNISFLWAPRQAPFRTEVKSTPECYKELTNDWIRSYLQPQMRDTCVVASDILQEALEAIDPLAVIVGLSQIHWPLAPDSAKAILTSEPFARHKSRIVFYNHKIEFTPMFAHMASMGYNVLVIAQIVQAPGRFCENTHLGGPAGSIAARALFWILKRLAG